ncbi:hypothetical protein EV702DRAFT_1111225 [Suillus placidus]|uniref:Uncharacterized protein n=1 Tax=Suillus placidus TaxID=48579 RepID=A0A9P7D1P3_9AGAM|nr:hypothetical protein EV702DRAFT_1111225 [Suillus placidus]
MNRIQNVFHHFSLVRVDDINQFVGNHTGDSIQVQWVNEPNRVDRDRARLFFPRVDMFMRTYPVLGVAHNEFEVLQFDQQPDGSYVIRSGSDNVNRLVLNHPAGPLTIEPAPLVDAPDFNKQFWRLVGPQPEFIIQNVLNARSIAVIEDPANPDNCIVVSHAETDEGSPFLLQSMSMGRVTLYNIESIQYITIDPAQNQVKCADNEEAAHVFQLDLQDNGSYVIHADGDNTNRLVLNDANQVTNEPAPPPDAPNFEKQFWRLIAP